jgi:aminomethyltransferase
MSEGYEALRSGAAWLDLSPRGRIVATGDDRARLLHAITTNHIQGLGPGAGCYAFLLNVQGQIQADLNILCFADRFLLDTEPEAAERVLAHIDKYIIADDVALEDARERLTAVAVEGPRAEAVMASLGAPAPAADYAHEAWNGRIVQRASSTGAPGFRLFLDAAGRARLVEELERAGARPATAAEARIVRLEHGRPRYGEDILETTLPQESRQMHAVHFNKGCYLGQEIVERVRARGRVNRLLAALDIHAEEPPAPRTRLNAGGADAGEITSAAYSPALARVVALAYVRAPHAEPGTELDAGGIAARVR